MRVAHRDLGREPAAERIADQMRVLDFELIEDVEIEIGEVVNGIEPVRRIALAEPGMFRRDDVVFLRECLQERQPARAACAMQINQRIASAAAHQPDAAASDRNHRRRMFRHPLSLLIHAFSVKTCATRVNSTLSCAPPRRSERIPQCYPQTASNHLQIRFNLPLAAGALSSLSDRSRLVLPDVTIAKVRSAWVRSRYRRCITW